MDHKKLRETKTGQKHVPDLLDADRSSRPEPSEELPDDELDDASLAPSGAPDATAPPPDGTSNPTPRATMPGAGTNNKSL